MHYFFGGRVVGYVVQRSVIGSPIPFVRQIYFVGRTELSIFSLNVLHQSDGVTVVRHQRNGYYKLIRRSDLDFGFGDLVGTIDLRVDIFAVHFDLDFISACCGNGYGKLHRTCGEFPAAYFLHHEGVDLGDTVSRYRQRIVLRQRSQFGDRRVSGAFHADVVSAGDHVDEHIVTRGIGNGAVHRHAVGIGQSHRCVIQGYIAFVAAAFDASVSRPVYVCRCIYKTLTCQKFGQVQIQ